MIPNSLRFRLLGAAAIVILFAVQIVGVVLLLLFEHNVLRWVHSELDATLDQLATFLSHDADGTPRLANELADAHFRQRLSGRYWQVSADGQVLLRSRSLGSAALNTKDFSNLKQGEIARQPLVGPDGQQLYGAVRRVVFAPPGPGLKAPDYLLIAAMDVAEIRALDALNSQLRGNVLAVLAVLFTVLLFAAWLQVQVGLSPLEVLRTGLEKIRIGNARRLTDEVPSELRPLVDETNRLLEAQEHAIDAARATAGDLAHGIKTPLTALTVLVAKIREEHKTELAAEFDHHLKSLNRHVERELRRARTAARATVTQRASVGPIVGRLLRTMETLPRGDQIDWTLDCPVEVIAPVDEEDLTEVLGNLLDNARKWARSEVGIAVRSVADKVEISVEDDGPGVPEDARARVMRRGTRLDESVPGWGLGLSIVKTVVEAYGGEMVLESSPRGGLLVKLRFSSQSRLR